ncbi:MAG: hypothetical protein QM648_08150 [Solirubrobacterales bacterium]
MTAATLKTWRTTERTSNAGDLIPFSVGGALFGAFAVSACFVLDAVILSIGLTLSGSGPGGDSTVMWPAWAVVVTGVVAVVMSCIWGVWLFRSRRAAVTDDDPIDHDTAKRKRRHFVVASMLVYALLTPGVWAAMLAYANTA